MPNTEVIYPDGSMSTFHADGGAFHDGPLAIDRLRLLTAISALSIYIRTNGAMQLTRNGAHLAVVNVIQPITGRKYKRSMLGKIDALADAEYLLSSLEQASVVIEDTTPRCDVCREFEDDVDAWCGGCGCCRAHCQQFEDCEER